MCMVQQVTLWLSTIHKDNLVKQLGESELGNIYLKTSEMPSFELSEWCFIATLRHQKICVRSVNVLPIATLMSAEDEAEVAIVAVTLASSAVMSLVTV